MTKATCAERGCREAVSARGLCERDYGLAYRQGKLPPKQLMLDVHSLSNVDFEAKLADCAVCGSGVAIRVRTRTRDDRQVTHEIQCAVKARERNQRSASRHPRRPWKGTANPQAKSAANRRRERLKWKFGITPDDYLRMLNEQGGACAICGRSQPEHLAVDHDHRCCPGKKSCGKCVRGLLCRSCNLALGYMRDDPSRLQSAIEYLAAATLAAAS